MNKHDTAIADLTRRVRFLMTAVDHLGEQLQLQEIEQTQARRSLDITLTMQYAHLKQRIEQLETQLAHTTEHRQQSRAPKANRHKKEQTPWGPRMRRSGQPEEVDDE